MIGSPLSTELVEMQQNWGRRGKVPSPEWRLEPSAGTGDDAAFDGDWVGRLWQEGEVCWAAIHSAGHRVRAGARAGLATILFSDDPRIADDPLELLDASARLLARPRGLNLFEGVAESAAAGNGLALSSAAQRLHPAFCTGKVIWSARVLVTAASTPTGRIADALVPLIRVPQLRFRTVALAPVFVWGEPLVRRWENMLGLYD